MTNYLLGQRCKLKSRVLVRDGGRGSISSVFCSALLIDLILKKVSALGFMTGFPEGPGLFTAGRDGLVEAMPARSVSTA